MKSLAECERAAIRERRISKALRQNVLVSSGLALVTVLLVNAIRLSTKGSSFKTLSLSLPQEIRSRVSERNQTLVIIIGNIRGGEKAWETLFLQVLDPNMADLALSVGSGGQNSTSLHKRAKYIWEHSEFDDWGDAIDLIPNIDLNWRQTILPRYNSKTGGIFGGVKSHIGSAAVIFMARFFLSQKLIEHDLVKQYEYFVVTRSDHYYRCVHNISSLVFDTPYTVFSPGGQDYGGVTDRHLVAKRHAILKALDVYPTFLRNGGNCTALKPNSYAYDPEWLLGCRWKEERLQRRLLDRIMYTCAADSDESRWSRRSKFLVPEGVHIKYMTEYEHVYETCKDEDDFPSHFCSGCRLHKASNCFRVARLIFQESWDFVHTVMSRKIAAQHVMDLLPFSCNLDCRVNREKMTATPTDKCPLVNLNSTTGLNFSSIQVLCPACNSGKCLRRVLILLARRQLQPEIVYQQAIQTHPECFLTYRISYLS